MMSWRTQIGRLTQTLRLMVGLPDYENYVRHRMAHHPGEPIPSKAEFVRQMQERRYNGKSNNRCC